MVFRENGFFPKKSHENGKKHRKSSKTTKNAKNKNTPAIFRTSPLTRAAFIQYTVGDGDSITEFYFQHDIDTFDNLVDSVVYAKGFTLTGSAISHAHNDVVKNHARPGAHVSMIVVTDGESFDQVLGPSNTARGDSVDMYAVGIQNYNLAQLEDIASLPRDKFLHAVDSFEELGDILEPLTRALCA